MTDSPGAKASLGPSGRRRGGGGAPARDSWRRHAVPAGALTALNLLLRGAWLWFLHPPQVDDFDWYFHHAAQMAAGQGYVWYGHPTAYWPMGYPFFLSLLFRAVGPSVAAGLAANALFSVAIVLCVYGLTWQVTRSRVAAVCAAAAYTLLPSQVEWNAVLGSEELFTLLLVACIWCLVASWGARSDVPTGSDRVSTSRSADRLRGVGPTVAAGVLLGLAADVRPIVLLFPAAAWLFRWRVAKDAWLSALGWSALFAAGMAAGVAPVTIRNALALHHFVLVSTNGGVNLWQGTHANGSYFWSWNPHVNPLLPYVQDDVMENQVATRAAIQFYLHHPLHLLWGGLLKWFFLYWVDWNVVSVTFAELPKRFSPAAVHVAMWFDTGVYYLWMAASVLGMCRCGSVGGGVRPWHRVAPPPGRTVWVWLPLWYCAYNTAIFFFFPAWDRFRYPMMPFFAVYVGVWGASRLARRRKEEVDGGPATVA
ncbi:MAG: hypothetical protein K6T78_07140 [Alicyclobacillus sp.]|nr:hypothetical protein [Alicyclobacillus sp.]